MPLLRDSDTALSGLYEGLMGGLQSINQDMKDRAALDQKKKEHEDDKKYKDLDFSLKASEQGRTYDPVSGTISSASPGFLSKREFEMKKLQQEGDLRRESIQSQKENRQDSLDLRKQLSEQNSLMRQQGLAIQEGRNSETKNQHLEGNVQKFSDKVGNAQELANSLSNLESKLGFSLDDADASDGSVKVRGKNVDLPGISVPGYGRVNAYSGDARRLDSALQKIFNVELKDRSGAAVTSGEMERLKNEFSAGKFNTEAEMIQAVKDYKRSVANELKNREAAFSPDVVNTYKDRGGFTYRNLMAPDKGGLLRSAKPDFGKMSDEELKAYLGK